MWGGELEMGTEDSKLDYLGPTIEGTILKSAVLDMTFNSEHKRLLSSWWSGQLVVQHLVLRKRWFFYKDSEVQNYFSKKKITKDTHSHILFKKAVNTYRYM